MKKNIFFWNNFILKLENIIKLKLKNIFLYYIVF